MTAPPRQRGPRKGDGGRPALKLFNDPDRWIVLVMLWLRDDPKEQRASATLEAIDWLLTPHDSVELTLGTRVREGVEQGCLSLVLTEPARLDSSNSNLPGRQPLAAPGGRAFRRSRTKLLQQKVALYRRKNLSEHEAQFCRLAFLTLDFIAGGRGAFAGPMLAMLGWSLTGPARDRLAGILDTKGIL